MLKSSGCSFFATILAIATIVLAIDQASAKQPQKSKAVPTLGAYGIDIRQTSVSGVSSGGAMAVQMHVSHSSIMRGVGVIAGVTYDCANSSLSTSAQRVVQGLRCLPGNVDYAQDSIARTDASAGVSGAIDDPAANLPRQKVWLFSGYNDGSVRRGAMNSVNTYYRHYVTNGNVFYQTDNRAPHALVTDDYGGPCLGDNAKYVNNCGYDAAGKLLQHIYGRLNPRDNNAANGPVLAFDQREFVAGGNPKSIGLADTGYVYVPNSCQPATPCRVHIVFHGCKQYAAKVGDAVYRRGGYNKWASTNQLIVLYPQTTASIENPEGCFDWFGFQSAARYERFRTQDRATDIGIQEDAGPPCTRRSCGPRRARQVRNAQTVLNHGRYVELFGYGLAAQRRSCWRQCLSCDHQHRLLLKNKHCPGDGRQFRRRGT